MRHRHFLYALGFELGLGALGALGGLLTGVPAAGDLRWDGRAVAYALAATLPLIVWFAVSWQSEREPLREIRRTLERLLPTLVGGRGVLGVLAVAVAAGVGEELLFRGFVQGSLESVIGPVLGLVAASIVFGLAHSITPVYALVATLMALYLGAAWRFAGNLIVPITIHAAYDAAVIWYVLWMQSAVRVRER